jgi:glucuronoarabinoxylan endo-1,4-beta-xylanase
MRFVRESSISKRLFTLIFVICQMTFIAQGASTITITPSTRYQTIDGFGAMSYDNVGSPTFFHDSLSATITRMYIEPGLQPSNNMTDSTNSDLSKFSVSGMGSEIAQVNQLKQYGDMKFIATCWSPPYWMKDSTRDPLTDLTCYNTPASYCGGHLSTRYYQAFAGFVSAYCRIMKTQTGIDLYAVNIQNEPYFIEPYWSCVYTPQEYTNVLKVVAARLKKDGVKTQCYGPDDVVDALAERFYAQAIAGDTAALNNMKFWSVHGYNLDGVTPTSEGGAIWSMAGNLRASLMKKNLWMTEASGWAQLNWTDAMNLASNLFMALKYAQISAWVYWKTNECSAQGLLCNNAHTRISLVSKNYYKFVRPGAVSIGCVCTGDTVYPVAFSHAQDKTLTIVIVNQSTVARQLTLASATPLPAAFEKYTTTSVKKCVDEGSFASSSAISIDANSVTTLFATNYSVNIADNGKINRSAMPVVKKENRYFRIDGSSVEGSSRLHRGIFIRAVQNNGNLRITPVTVIK